MSSLLIDEEDHHYLSEDDDYIFNDDNDNKSIKHIFPLCHGKTKANWGTDGISWYYHVEKLNHEDAFEKT